MLEAVSFWRGVRGLLTKVRERLGCCIGVEML